VPFTTFTDLPLTHVMLLIFIGAGFLIVTTLTVFVSVIGTGAAFALVSSNVITASGLIPVQTGKSLNCAFAQSTAALPLSQQVVVIELLGLAQLISPLIVIGSDDGAESVLSCSAAIGVFTGVVGVSPLHVVVIAFAG